MPLLARVTMLGAIGFLTSIPTGCCCFVPRSALEQCCCQQRALYSRNAAIGMERDHVLADRQRLEQSLAVANRRIDNLQADREHLKERYISLLNKPGNQPSPLSARATERLKDLQRRYPEFEFDPATGVSRFHSDILFDIGSAELKPCKALEEFAHIMNESDAHDLNILVVGHTDDMRIARAHTKAHHPTNWHLSTNRANSVVLALSRSGIDEKRMGAAGYSMFQPVAPNKDNATRQMNRRVEIFVLAPDATVASWDPATSRN
jgi:chemotaxis protein MotB